MKLKKVIANDGNRFFDDALTSTQMQKLTGGVLVRSGLMENLDSCGCHTCANLCCSGFGNSCPNLA